MYAKLIVYVETGYNKGDIIMNKSYCYMCSADYFYKRWSWIFNFIFFYIYLFKAKCVA